ncbi:MAG: hypothetical protein ACTHWZ_09065 [Peptoniphilaceae bacterium]
MKKITTVALATTLVLSMAGNTFAAEVNMKDLKDNAAKVETKVEEKSTEIKEEVKEKVEKAEEKAEEAKELKEEAEVKAEEAKKEEARDVMVSPQKVTLDGKEVAIFGYNIDGENYFKLRDLAAVVKDTDAKFGVDYRDNMVSLTKAGDYKVLDTDQKEVEKEAKAMLTNDKVMIGETELMAKAYKINNNNYYRLRDLGKELNFGVDYDKEKDTVLLTSKVEVEEKVEEAKEKAEEAKELKEKAEAKAEEAKKDEVKVVEETEK